MERRPGERKIEELWIRFYQESSDSRKLRFVEIVDVEVAADVKFFAGATESNIYGRIVARDEQSL